jgi:hypothetical protein
MLGTGGRAASHLNYLEVQACSAGTASREPFGAPLDWSIHSGSIKPNAYV